MVEIVIDQRVSLLIPKKYLNLPEGTIKIHFNLGEMTWVEIRIFDFISLSTTNYLEIPGLRAAIDKLEKMRVIKNFKVLSTPTSVSTNLDSGKIQIDFSYTKEDVLEELKDLYTTIVTNNIITKTEIEDRLLNSIIKLQNI